jgi:hypothetical protein
MASLPWLFFVAGLWAGFRAPDKPCLALWLREAPTDADPPGREFAILAQALVNGRDLAEIAIMRDIAMRTVAVLADALRQAG